MLFDDWYDLARVAAIAVLSYGSLILILRVAGKRSLAKLNIFDFVVTVALGSTLANVLLSREVSLSEGALAFAMLAMLQWAVSSLSVRANWFKRLIRSDPRLLLRDGQCLDEAMRRERITRGEIEAAIRKKGHGSTETVAAVVLESDGELSVITQGTASECSALSSVKGPE
jgi:uncharacterized membrane protein YcaP (DUF421 family)